MNEPVPLTKLRCYGCGSKLPTPRVELSPRCIECRDGQMHLVENPHFPPGFVPLDRLPR